MKLTATFRSLLSFLPSFFGTSDEVLTFMLCMVDLLLVMSFLQRPPVPDAVEYAGKKCCVSDDLKGRLGRSRVRRERMWRRTFTVGVAMIKF